MKQHNRGGFAELIIIFLLAFMFMIFFINVKEESKRTPRQSDPTHQLFRAKCLKISPFEDGYIAVFKTQTQMLSLNCIQKDGVKLITDGTYDVWYKTVESPKEDGVLVGIQPVEVIRAENE